MPKEKIEQIGYGYCETHRIQSDYIQSLLRLLVWAGSRFRFYSLILAVALLNKQLNSMSNDHIRK
jgi:hypothetical protein